MRRQFPGAHVQASTFDAFLLPLAQAVRDGLDLPVVTQEASQETFTCAWRQIRPILCLVHSTPAVMYIWMLAT